MWKKPSRPDHTISATFNSGVVRICSVTDQAQPGRKPVPRLREKVRLAYEDRRVGIARYYSAQQAQARVDRVVRVPDPGRSFAISPQDAAITEDGTQYRVEQVQLVPDAYPASLDLTLTRIEQIYEVIP